MANLVLLAVGGVAVVLLLQNMSNPNTSLIAKFKKNFLNKVSESS